MLPAVTVETEASQMLEAALEQMDDIIAGKKVSESSKRVAGDNSRKCQFCWPKKKVS